MSSTSALGVVADDLSGALECAAVLGPGTPVLLTPDAPAPSGAGALVVDADARRHGPDAEALLTAALGRLGGRTPFLKVDSLLRGPVAPAVGLAARRGPVVLCPALPSHGRVVRDGVLTLHGVPLHQTTAWHLEPGPVPRSVAEAACTSVRSLTRAELRSGGLAAALSDGGVVVPDVDDDADLALVAQGLREHPGALAVGSSDLLRALVGPLSVIPRPSPARTASRVLVLVGSASDEAAEQTRRLLAARRVTLVPTPVLPGSGLDVADLRRRLSSAPTGTVVLTLPPPDPRAPLDPALLAEQVGLVVADAARDHPSDLVLIGGATARGVLAALGVHLLTVLAQIHPGAVASTDGSGRALVTRPGSHGGPDSLVHLLDWLEGTRR